jgi:ferric-dicitrate binding protein FerR (iron transport regulator)
MPSVSELISQILLKKLRHEVLSPEELVTLAEWEGRSPEHAEFIAMLMNEAALSDKIKGMLELDKQGAWQKIEKALEADWNERTPGTTKTSWYKYAIAASVILVLGLGGYYLLNETVSKKPATIADFAPGDNRAVLKLADGSEIDLAKEKEGEITSREGTRVIKLGEGKLSYETSSASTNYLKNTLSTPRGGYHTLILPDSTICVLNASSSITYPINFSGTERRVTITGEAYFEVAKHQDKKFIVDVNTNHGEKKVEIEVMGTHFNIMAYDEEQIIATSLLEGKITITPTAPPKAREVTPGEQAQLTPDNKLHIVKDADMEQAVAWKNGTLSFQGLDIRETMRVISRWYNVEVEFVGNVDFSDKLHGEAPNNMPLATLIELLRENRVNCSFENGKLIVKPN